MVLLQPRLNLKVSQRQILTPGLVQMVSVLALNKLELRDMITAEMVENPVLEELEDSVPLLDDAVRREEERERVAPEENTVTTPETKDPFEEIDFGSFFQEYLDPGFRSRNEMEEIERPSFENFLSKPGNLTDHLMWQLGALSIRPPVREAAELVIGNLNEEGYLIASDEELLGVITPASPEQDASLAEKLAKQATALGLEVGPETAIELAAVAGTEGDVELDGPEWNDGGNNGIPSADAEFPAQGIETFVDSSINVDGSINADSSINVDGSIDAVAPNSSPETPPDLSTPPTFTVNFVREDLHEAIELI